MKNPFRYGGVVDKESFCNREREIHDIMRSIENEERLFLFSERRMGKTSLIRRILSGLPKKKFLIAYVDLWPTDGVESFTETTAKAIADGLETSTGKMLQTARLFFGSLSPAITTDSSGNPQISFQVIRNRSIVPSFNEVLTAPERIADRRQCQVVIVFDEFQRILEYEDDYVERMLRSVIQNQKGVAYIFLGSRKHLIQNMFLDESRPFYRSGTHYPLGPIGENHWQEFILGKFCNTGKNIDKALISDLCRVTGGHPFYTQHVCHVIWELCPFEATATSPMLKDAIDLLLERESYAYSALWESFRLNQRRFLTGLAHPPSGTKVYSAEFISHNNLRSSSTVQRIVQTLYERDIIDRDNGSFVITDRFFRLWILKLVNS